MIEILYISDCCGAYLADCHVEYGICPDCREHCEVLTEEYAVSPASGGWRIENGLIDYTQHERKG